MTVASVSALAVCTCAVSSASAARRASFGYALAASGFKSYFVFDSRPDGSVTGVLQVTSLTSGAKTILLEPVDVTTAASGGLQFGLTRPRGDGGWLRLGETAVTLSGHGTARVPFAVDVGRGATGGEHFAGIVAVDRRVLSESASGRGPIRLRLIPRLAMTVELRLPGRRVTALGVGPAAISVTPSGASVALRLDNPGDTLVDRTRGRVEVSQGTRRLFSAPVQLGPFVPRTAIAYEVPWQGRPVQGTYRVSGELTPAGGRTVTFTRTVTFGAPAIRRFRRETGRSATLAGGISIVMIVLLSLATLAAAVFAGAYFRARSQLAIPPAAAPASTGGGIHLHSR